MGTQVLSAAILLALVTCLSASYVTLTSDGYIDIVIRIEDDAVSSGTTCQEVINSIKSLMTETSAALSKSLDKAPFFGNVTVIVPDTWRDGTCAGSLNGSAVWPRAHKADIRITADHPVFGSWPHTFQYGPCGHPALPIHLPVSFMTLNNFTAKGKRLVREWAHYRYGIFDEGGVPSDPLHPSNYRVLETSGSTTSVANECVGNATVGTWNKDTCPNSDDAECEFTAADDNPNVETSLMYRPDLSHMTRFCDRDTHPLAMPSKHNFHCHGKSATEVIYQHVDFGSPYTKPVERPLDIQFMNDPFKGYHIIIDTSLGQEQMRLIKAAVSNFIMMLPDGLLLSVDSFNGSSTVVVPPVITSDDTKYEAQRAIDNIPASDSNVGFVLALDAGLQRALSGQDIILMTSVTNPSTGNLNNLLDRYRLNKVNVHLLYFRREGQSNTLFQLTEFGSVHHIPAVIDDTDSNPYTWVVDSLQIIYKNTHIPRELVYEKTAWNATDSINETFVLDGSISRLTFVIYDLNDYDDFLVKDPTITNSHGVAGIGEELQACYYVFFDLDPSLRESTWTYSLVLRGSTTLHNVRVSAWAESSSSSFINLKTWTSSQGNRNLDPSTSPVAVFAQLSHGRRPIHSASVKAKVFSPDRSGTFRLIQQLVLQDHGPADVTSGDGIYSAFLTSLSTNTTIYSIRFEADDNNGTAKFDTGIYGRNPTTGSRIPLSAGESVARFKRLAYGPSLELKYLPSATDQMPPGRVTDLAVAAFNADTRVLTLSFTAPLDNYGAGDLVQRFKVMQRNSAGDETQVDDVRTSGNETEVSVTVTVPEDGEPGTFVSYYVLALDSNSNPSASSNVVSIRVPFFTGLATWAWGLIGAGIGLLVIVAIILLFCCCCPEKCSKVKRKTRNTRHWVKEKTTRSKRDDTVGTETRVRSEDWRSPPSEPEVELRQKSPNQGYQENFRPSTYFGGEDFDHISDGPDGHGEREMNEVVKRAPSMDLQLATILIQNSSNLSIDHVGLDGDNRKVYTKPNNPSAPGLTTIYANYQTDAMATKSMSQSDTHLHYAADGSSSRPGQRSSLSQSHSSIYVDHRKTNSLVHPAISSLASTLRAGLEPGARGESWQDSNSFVYNDPRFDDQPKSTFDPLGQSYNATGLPPPVVTRSYAMAAAGSRPRATSPIVEDEEIVSFDRPKSSLVSAV